MKTTTFARSMVYAAVMIVLVLPACGGSSGGSAGSCLQVEPCGGNLVGSWSLSNACINSAAISMQFAGVCPTAAVTAAHVTASGSLMFNADMTYSTMLNEGGTFSVSVPASCINGGSCTLLGAALQDPSFQSVTCTGSTTCVCNVVLAPMITNETGTYTTSGTAAMLTTSTGTTDGGDYCVQGNELHLVTVDRTMNMGPMGQATINEDIVAIKK
jgi:hypothetical protein